jgi:SAM-dependent methyltransferase
LSFLECNDTTCLVCGGALREYAAHGRWTVAKCRDCGFGQTNVTEKDLAGFYESEYFDGNRARFCQKAQDEISENKKWWLDRFVQGEHLRCLEIGPGPAAMVPGFLADNRSGFSYSAVEISRAASDQLRKRGYEVFTGKIYDEQISARVAGRFDYVVATEVIEHDTNPRGFVCGVFSALRPGGRACLTTGNFDGLTARFKGASWSYLDPPAHVCFFTPRSVHKLFTNAGFCDVRVHCVGLNYIRLYQRFPIPGMLAAVHWLRLPTGMTICAQK